MRTAVLFRAALAASVALVAASVAEAQEGGGLLPGANGVRRPDGGALTTCTARNALATKQCTSTCPAGQTADCEDADGGGDPACGCSSE